MAWVSFLRQKFDVFNAFKSLVETQFSYKSKNLRWDHGKEYISTKFEQFCEHEGPQQQLTVGYCPKKMEIEYARSMLGRDYQCNCLFAQ